MRLKWPLDNVQIIHPTELESSVLNDSEVDGCIIATPTPTHESLVRKCLEAGKHVCCEKPLAPSLARKWSERRLSVWPTQHCRRHLEVGEMNG